MLSRSLSNHLRQEPVESLSDTQLVEAMQDGNERAFHILVNRWNEPVFNTVGGVEFFPSRDSANQRTDEEMQQDLEAFIESTKDLLLDYGRTLDTVKSDKSIMLHFNLRTSNDALPDKLIFSVNKDVIENYDKRSISKDEAKKQISVVKH